MSVRRLLDRPEQEPEPEAPYVLLAEWREMLTGERDWLIMRLRAVERVMIRHKWLENESLPRRER